MCETLKPAAGPWWGRVPAALTIPNSPIAFINLSQMLSTRPATAETPYYPSCWRYPHLLFPYSIFLPLLLQLLLGVRANTTRLIALSLCLRVPPRFLLLITQLTKTSLPTPALRRLSSLQRSARGQAARLIKRPGAHGLAGRATYRGLCRQDYTPMSVTSTTKSPRGARAAVYIYAT